MKTTNAYLDKQRLIGDAPADQLINSLFQDNRQGEMYRVLQWDAEQILAATADSPVLDFLQSGKKKPVWFDANRILRGQQLFERYAADMMMLLGAMALPYCYAASPGNKALYASEKMRKNPGKRLLDTASFVIGVSTPGSFTENETGYIHINRTRLMHAIARYYVLKGEWNRNWGLPVNQEDMAGTNLAFSVVVLLGLQQSGILLSQQEKEDFIYLWRYIGYHLNINEQLLPSDFREGYALANIIRKRNFRVSEEGIELTRELLNYYRSAVPPDQARFIDAQVRYYLGKEVSSFIGLKPDPLLDSVNLIISDFKAMQNIFSVQKNTYQQMITNHRQLQQMITAR